MRFRSFPIDLGELLNLWASVYSRASIELLIEVISWVSSLWLRVWGVALRRMVAFRQLLNHFLSTYCMPTLCQILDMHSQVLMVCSGDRWRWNSVSFSFIYLEAPVLGECTFRMSFWSVDSSVLGSCTWPRVCTV